MGVTKGRISVTEAARRWNISERGVRWKREKGTLPAGWRAEKDGRRWWLIPPEEEREALLAPAADAAATTALVDLLRQKDEQLGQSLLALGVVQGQNQVLREALARAESHLEALRTEQKALTHSPPPPATTLEPPAVKAAAALRQFVGRLMRMI